MTPETGRPSGARNTPGARGEPPMTRTRPDPVELVLQTAWSRPASGRHKPLHPEIQRAIDKIAEAWWPPIPLPATHTAAVQDLLRRGARRPSQAKKASAAVSLQVLWWFSNERAFDLPRMLSAVWLVTFRDALATEGYSPGTQRDYIELLNDLGALINPHQDEEWKALDSTPTQRAGYSLPNDDDEVWDLFLLAWTQPTAKLRDGLLGLLYLTLGCGLYEGPLTRVHGTDVRRGDDGTVVVAADGRQLVVRPRYAEALLELARRAGRKPLVPGASGKNKASEFIKKLFVPAGTHKPDVDRLVATHRWWADKALHIEVLVDQSGPNVLVHLADIHRRLPRQVTAASRSALAPPGDVEDGPWAPDWPARHHRS